MKPKELIEELQKLPSDLDIAIVEGVTNEHIYNFHCGYLHISGDENYFEMSFDFTFKMILKWIISKIKIACWKLKNHKKLKLIFFLDRKYDKIYNYKK